MPKASACESLFYQSASITGKPSARNRPVSPGVIERWEGLCRLLPEPTPSPRLWASVRARPRSDTITLTRPSSSPHRTTHFYLAEKRTFLFGVDKMRESVVQTGLQSMIVRVGQIIGHLQAVVLRVKPGI